MKRILNFSLLMITFLVTYTSVSQEDFLNIEVVNTVFNALKEQSEKEFLKVLPTKNEVEYLIPIVKETQPNDNVPSVDAIILNFENKAIENYRRVSERGRSFGVLWKDIILEKVSFKSNPDNNVPIERGSITLECSNKDKKFLIVLKKVYKIQDTWRVMDSIKFTLL
ncbi:hypothetical protein CLV90_1195 [Maribacter spongiicola]|uniref:Uncharacterized protein n=1 Tax=Maribacter spongiicola TaxID=1206753 RepID=A0A4R7KAT1_9FLAO|nr:hypothetical protein [Maribacter spongiicola]TDT47124.1 hypothetical protein CLV90_1195 [Maribacter spongiicola]